jgi:hypothetical protein
MDAVDSVDDEAALVVEIHNHSTLETLVIDGTHGRRVIPPASQLRLTVLPTTVYVLRAERATDPTGTQIL